MLEALKRPFRPDVLVALQPWVAQYRRDPLRYKFLVLPEVSRTGKSTMTVPALDLAAKEELREGEHHSSVYTWSECESCCSLQETQSLRHGTASTLMKPDGFDLLHTSAGPRCQDIKCSPET